MHRSLSVLVFVGVFITTGLAQRPQPLAWEPIEIQASGGAQIDAERAWLEVPERHARPQGAKIHLSIVRLRATGPNAGPQIIWLAGGPGESGVARVAHTYPLFAALRGYGDVIAFDQRGTGMAQPSLVVDGRLDLPSDQSVDSDAIRMRMTAVADLIRNTMQGRGVDLAAYNTHESADDVDALRQALGAERVVLVAHSYGTHLALAVLKYHQNGVQRVVLGGVNGLGDRWREPSASDAWLQRVAAAVRADSDAAAFDSDFVGQVKRVLTQLGRVPLVVANPTGNILVGKSEIQLLVTVRSGDLEFVQGLPALFDSLEKRTRQEEIARLVQQTLRQRPIGTAMTYGMHVASGVSAARKSAIRIQTLQAVFGNAINWGLGDEGFVRALAVPDLGEAFRATFRSNVPALLISGTLDGRTSETEARAAGQQFARATYVTINGASHDFFFRRQPGLTEIIGAFLSGQPVSDTSLDTTVKFRRP